MLESVQDYTLWGGVWLMTKTPYAGNLRHSVNIQSRTASADSGGGFTSSWSTTRAVFADIVPVTGNQSFSDGSIRHDITHDVYIPYYANVNFSSGGGKMRIQWDDSGTTRTLSIRSVINIKMRDRFLQLRCAEGGINDATA